MSDATVTANLTVSPKGRNIKQFLRFAVIGFLNAFVDLAVLNILIWLTHSGRAGVLYSVFKAISFTVAVINSYYFNRKWVFKGQETSQVGVEFSKFIVISIIGAFVNVGVASLFANFSGPILRFIHLIPGISQVYDACAWVLAKITSDVWATVSAMFGSAAGLIWNFVGYKFLVFIKKT
jgi:putative flippase GtrA